MSTRLKRAPKSVGRGKGIQLGPWVGMRNLQDPTAASPEFAYMLRNVYSLDPESRARLEGRPGFAQMGAQLGTAGRRTPQLFHQFTTLAGTRHTIAIVGGYFYTLNWGTSTWTEVVTNANLATASITLSQTARCYAVTFANTVVISDGTNKPWTWDGTSGAGGLVSLTNAPAMFGQPVVHYGKLFGIVAATRSQLQWSEENAANTGYTAGGYNNAWTLGQTDTDALYRLLPSNELLYVFRARSMTAIAGEVTPNFSSTGTREAISSTRGTTSPASVFFEGSNVVFADADGQPCIMQPGGAPVSYWEFFNDTLETMDPASIHEIEGFYDPTLELSRIGFQSSGAAADRDVQMALYPSHEGYIAAGIFDGYEFGRIDVVENADGEPRVLHGDSSGNVYVHGVPDGTTWSDDGELIRHEIVTGLENFTDDVEWHYGRLDYSIVAKTDLTNVAFSFITAYGESVAIEDDQSGIFPLWDVMQWDVDVWAAPTLVKHGAIGIDEIGNYIGVRVVHSTLNERFGLLSMTLRTRPVDDLMEAP